MLALERQGQAREGLRECIQCWKLHSQVPAWMLLLFLAELCAVLSVQQLASWDTDGVQQRMPLIWRALKRQNPL
jgi:hypothetical protein